MKGISVALERKRHLRYLTAAITGAAGLALLATACSSSGGTSSSQASSSGGAAPYKVVIVASITGTADSNGISGADGFQAAFDTINAQGGIDGHKIDFSVLDDQSSATQAPAMARQAVAENPAAIMDATVSTYISYRMPIYESAKIPVFSNEAISFGLWPWLYSDATTTSQASTNLASMAQLVLGGSLKGRKVAFVGASTPANTAYAPIIKSLVEKAGGTLVTTQYQTIGAPTFSSGAANVVASGANVVVISDTPPDNIVEVKALQSEGFKGAIATNWGGANDTTLKTIASPQFYGQYLVPDVTPGSAMYTAASKYNLLAGTTTGEFGKAWALAYMLADGLKKCDNSCSPANLEAAVNSLGSFSVPGDQFGDYHVSGNIHNVLQYFQMYRWNSSTSSASPYGKPVSAGSPDYSGS
jgi:branched-chain amino acid transport system substrate-binding protein